jgi:hypothetical protein
MMPRYFFDVTNGGHLTRDDHGIELVDDEEARDQAIALLPDIARDELPDGDEHEFVAAARNETGEVVYEANLTLHGRWRPGRR